MNYKGAVIITGAAVIILLVMFLPIRPGDIPPAIEDDSQFVEQTTIGIVTGTETDIIIKENTKTQINLEDTPDIIESTVVIEETVDYYIDENGIKHYVINVRDSPKTTG